MEDWGLVSFRSSYLLYDEKRVTLDQKKMITLVIAHELAHQVCYFSYLIFIFQRGSFVLLIQGKKTPNNKEIKTYNCFDLITISHHKEVSGDVCPIQD